MKTVFLVFGYGIPDDILTDENYGLYLKIAANEVYARSLAGHPTVILCGGYTDMREPYDARSEAGEMQRFFEALIARRGLNRWKFIQEDQSISTLENFLGAKQLLPENVERVVIFCEATRKKRIQVLASKLLPSLTVEVVAIDFDQTKNRFRDRDLLKDKEIAVLAYDLWALESKENLAEHHKTYEEKFAYLRDAGTEEHVDALKDYWVKKWKEVQTDPRVQKIMKELESTWESKVE